MKSWPFVACALLAAAGAAHAQGAWPAKPIRMIVPFPSGSASDVTGRIVAIRLAEIYHQQIVADLEVRNTLPVTMLDGRPAARAGVRFVKRPRGIDKLIDRFVHDLDQD